MAASTYIASWDMGRVFQSLTAQSNTNQGDILSVITYGRVRFPNHALWSVIPSASNPSGLIALEGSIDGVNWNTVDSFTMVANTAFARIALDQVFPYYRLNPSGLTGGSVNGYIFLA